MAPQAIHSIQLISLPLISLLFTNENSLVGAGHDCQPYLFEGSLDAHWTQTRSLDNSAGRTENAARPGAVGRLNQSEAFNMFRAADSRGVGGAPTAQIGMRQTANGTELLTIHQNTITSVRAYTGGVGGEEVSQVSTTGVDGKLVIWSELSGVGEIGKGIERM